MVHTAAAYYFCTAVAMHAVLQLFRSRFFIHTHTHITFQNVESWWIDRSVLPDLASVWRMSRLNRDWTTKPVSRDQILRHKRGQGNIHFPCSADHERDWQLYLADPYSAITVYVVTIRARTSLCCLSNEYMRRDGWPKFFSIP